MKNWMISGLCWWGLLTGCQTKDGIRRLAPHDFEEALTTDSIAVCLDVRKPSEFAAGHLAGAASLNVLDTLAFEAGQLGQDQTLLSLLQEWQTEPQCRPLDAQGRVRGDRTARWFPGMGKGRKTYRN